MNDQTQQAEKLLVQICQAIVDVVAETPAGAPAGSIYAALLVVMPWLTALEYNCLIEALQRAGKLERHGNLLYPPASADYIRAI